MKPSKLRRALLRLAGGRGLFRAAAPAMPLPEGAFRDGRDPVVEVRLSEATSSFYFRFGAGGWSHFQEAASLCLAGGSRASVREYMQSYYQAFQPASLAEACFGSAALQPLASLSPFELFKPWRLEVRTISGAQGEGNQNFGPVTPAKLDLEVDRIVGACRALERHGYQPEKFHDGFIRGCLLIDGERHRFLVTSGVHRSAVLSAMGVEVVRVKFNLVTPRMISKSSLPAWPHVRSGFCSPTVAAELFDRHLETTSDFRRQLLEAHSLPENSPFHSLSRAG